MKRSELKRKTRLRPMSAKRRAAHESRVKPGVQIPAACELCELLWDVKRDPMLASLTTLDPHHGWGRGLDDPCNVVTACRGCHRWCHDHPKANRLIVAFALVRAGRFDRERIREAWGRDPIAAIEVDYQVGVFSSDAVLQDMAADLLERF